MNRTFLAWVTVLAVLPSFSALVPAVLFNDNMVLQREKKISVCR